MDDHQTNEQTLRSALWCNAVFSFVCAVIALFQSATLADIILTQDSAWFGLSGQLVVFAIGVGLSGFAVSVAITAAQRTIATDRAFLISIADFMWVLISVFLLVAGGEVLTRTGELIVVAVGAVVLAAGIAQIAGLLILYEGDSEVRIKRRGATRQVRVSRSVRAPTDVAWDVMTDHEGYVDVAENLARVEVLRGDGKGMARRCTSAEGETWTETAHIWEEGRRYGFVIDTERPDYPYPLKRLVAVWSVEPDGPGASIVTIAFEVEPLNTLKAGLFIRISMVMFPKLLDRLLAKWKARMEHQRGDHPAGEAVTTANGLPGPNASRSLAHESG
ncbi:MAG: SRPBCC family protein [Pseudomonadota bacterium]